MHAAAALGLPQLEQGAGFDLADALPGEVQVFADLGEGLSGVVLQAEAQADDLGLAAAELFEQSFEVVVELCLGRGPPGCPGRPSAAPASGSCESPLR